MKAMSQRSGVFWALNGPPRLDVPASGNQIIRFDRPSLRNTPSARSVVSDPRQMTVEASSSYYKDCVNRRIP
jgi:hypothetical protein